ncbi:MFS transporter [Metallosphaera javensis (ex Sakai et al. 2022)]|uniref:MFS transporter n=1 Tax=Metallosphaera javensis (ex Sakai et al. 2022) TaxID=2775498 RepID=UPI0025909BDC|nr:MAG: MFS transporter [Metallosphaera javensis (ex Sakai et al. 2022)]
MNRRNLEFIQVLLIIVSMTFAVRASNNMIGTTIPLLSKFYFHFTQTQVGFLSGLMSLGTFVTSGIVNARLRSHVRRKVFVISSVAYAVILPSFYLVNSTTIWIVSLLAGLSLGSIMPNIINSAGLLEDRRARERLLSIYTLALSASLVAGPALESAVLRFYPVPFTFLFFAPLGIVAGVLSLFIRFPEERNTSARVNVVRNPGFITAVINILAYNVPFSVILSFGGIYAVQQLHVSYAEVEGLFSLFFATSFLARIYLSIRPPDSVRAHAVLAISMTGLGLLLLVLSGNVLLFTLALLILGFPHGLTYPLSIISISRTFKPEERNPANSQFFATMMVIGVVTPSVAGLVADVVGLRTLFGALIPIVVVLLLLLNRYVRVVDEVTKVEKVAKTP